MLAMASFISLPEVTEVVKKLPNGKTMAVDKTRFEMLKALCCYLD